MAKKKASVRDIVLALAKERGLEVTDIQRIGGGGVKGRLESGAGFIEAFSGAGKEKIKSIGETFSKKGVKSFGKKVFKEFFKGDDIFSAYARGRLAKSERKGLDDTEGLKGVSAGGDKSPNFSKEIQQGATQGFSKESSEYLQIIAENTMGIQTMARDVNVLRQNLQELVKLWDDKKKGKGPASKADIHYRTESENRKRLESKVERVRKEDVDYFAEQDKREAELEASRQKTPTAAAAGAPEEKKAKEEPDSFLGTIISLFARGFMSAIKFILSPKRLLKLFSKIFLPAAIIGTIFSGIVDGFKKYQETGSFSDAIFAGLGGMLNFLTFGIFGEETVRNLYESVSDFLKPVIETISGIFTGIKNFFVKLFGGQVKVEDNVPAKAADVTPPPPKGGGGSFGGAGASGSFENAPAKESGGAAPTTTAPAATVPAGTPASTEATPSTAAKTEPAATPPTPTPTPAPATTETPSAQAPTKVVEPSKEKKPTLSEHDRRIYSENIKAAEGSIKLLEKDWNDEKGRMIDILKRDGVDFSTDPSSPKYPEELKDIDAKYKSKIQGKKAYIEELRLRSGMNEEPGAEAKKPTQIEGEKFATGEMAKVEEPKDQPRLVVNEKGEAVEDKSATGKGVKGKADLKQQLEKLDKDYEDEYESVVEKAKKDGKVRRRVKKGEEGLQEAEISNLDEIKALKEKHKAEREALLKNIEEGSGEGAKTASVSAPAPSAAKIAAPTEASSEESKSSAPSISAGGGGAGGAETPSAAPSSATSPSEVGAAGAGGTPGAGAGGSGGGGGSSDGGGASSESAASGSGGGGASASPSVEPAAPESSASEIKPTEATETPASSATTGAMISKTSAEVAEQQRMESAADEGSVVNAPTTNNNSGSMSQPPKPKTDDVYDTELIRRLAYT
jgi:hypothetical protein